VNKLSFSPDDKLLLAVADDGFLYIWSMQTGTPGQRPSLKASHVSGFHRSRSPYGVDPHSPTDSSPQPIPPRPILRSDPIITLATTTLLVGHQGS
jgi:WD40 repeat protein